MKKVVMNSELKFLMFLAWIALALVCLGDFIQTDGLGFFGLKIKNVPLYVPLKMIIYGIPCLFQWGLALSPLILIRAFKTPESKTAQLLARLRALPIPRGAKIVLLIIIIGQTIQLLRQSADYPLLHVGMFERSDGLPELPDTIIRHKYWYGSPDDPKILDLRREGHFLFSSLMPWSNEVSFSAAYHNRDLESTYRYITRYLSEQEGKPIELQLGTESYRYSDGYYSFDPLPSRPLPLDVAGHRYQKPIWDPRPGFTLPLNSSRLSEPRGSSATSQPTR